MKKGLIEDAALAASVVKGMDASELNAIPVDLSGGGAPDLTEQIIRAVLEDLKDVASNNGYVGIARKNGCSTAQVKVIVAARDARLNDLVAADEPIIPK